MLLLYYFDRFSTMAKDDAVVKFTQDRNDEQEIEDIRGAKFMAPITVIQMLVAISKKYKYLNRKTNFAWYW